MHAEMAESSRPVDADLSYPGERVQVDMMMRGFSLARERFAQAAELFGPEPAYFALFEALNWAVALDDIVGEIWRPEGERQGWSWRTRIEGAEVLIGIRVARNLAHHHWARALRFEPESGRPRWVWPPSSTLPPPVKSDQRAMPYYDTLMAGERVSDTLHMVDAIFTNVARFLLRTRPSTAP
jgi:hypothetical protein